MTDPHDRIPCPDDMCVGTINERGVCNYCGRSVEGTLPGEGESAEPEEILAGDDERIPCADDLCTGTVNEVGVCNYCGKVHPDFVGRGNA